MKSASGKHLTRLLERHGWLLLRVNGSHHIMGKQEVSSGCLSQSTATIR